MEADGPPEVVAERVEAAAAPNDGTGPTRGRGQSGRKEKSVDRRLWTVTSQSGCQEHLPQVRYRQACSTVREGVTNFSWSTKEKIEMLEKNGQTTTQVKIHGMTNMIEKKHVTTKV